MSVTVYQAVNIVFSQPVEEPKVIELAGRIRYYLIELEKRIDETIKNINNLAWMDKTGGSTLMSGKLKLIRLNLDRVVFFEKTEPNILRFSWPHSEMNVLPAQIAGRDVSLKKVIDENHIEKMLVGFMDEMKIEKTSYKIESAKYERDIQV